MLDPKKILNIDMDSDEWLLFRLGRFTSSEIHNLMGEKQFTKGAISYIYRKVGESITGMPQRDIVENEATLHGKVYEQTALNKYSQKYNIKYLSTQRLIVGKTDMFSCTPDALEILSINENGLYSVCVIEIKCPLTYEHYIRLALCDSSFDVKKEYPNYYYQVLDQMDNCGALTGKLIAFHPSFSLGNMKVIEFRIMEKLGDKYPLKDELDLLRKRKDEAVIKFNAVKEKILNLK
jgi:hypothetical protein